MRTPRERSPTVESILSRLYTPYVLVRVKVPMTSVAHSLFWSNQLNRLKRADGPIRPGRFFACSESLLSEVRNTRAYTMFSDDELRAYFHTMFRT
jgi:hypothetical protein